MKKGVVVDKMYSKSLPVPERKIKINIEELWLKRMSIISLNREKINLIQKYNLFKQNILIEKWLDGWQNKIRRSHTYSCFILVGLKIIWSDNNRQFKFLVRNNWYSRRYCIYFIDSLFFI